MARLVVPFRPAFGAAILPPGPLCPARNPSQPRPAGILAAQGRHRVGLPRERRQTSQGVSSVVGCAMHMKQPDGIGRGSWDWENPRQESANPIPALPVLTGHAIGCPLAGGSGQAPLRLLLLLLNGIYTYIYIYILLLVRLTVAPLYFP